MLHDARDKGEAHCGSSIAGGSVFEYDAQNIMGQVCVQGRHGGGTKFHR
jgi:hypothetical protein